MGHNRKAFRNFASAASGDEQPHSVGQRCGQQPVLGAPVERMRLRGESLGEKVQHRSEVGRPGLAYRGNHGSEVRWRYAPDGLDDGSEVRRREAPGDLAGDALRGQPELFENWREVRDGSRGLAYGLEHRPRLPTAVADGGEQRREVDGATVPNGGNDRREVLGDMCDRGRHAALKLLESTGQGRLEFGEMCAEGPLLRHHLVDLHAQGAQVHAHLRARRRPCAQLAGEEGVFVAQVLSQLPGAP
mmetsp:Transcript_85957/g.248115  ORF Transcript_85957/g.248115 Transcript_85957/m.248115 type:complete len:245 (-) Transcript_85957:856-1590(-)